MFQLDFEIRLFFYTSSQMMISHFKSFVTQTKEKELERQLKRETDKARGLDLRVKEFREDNLKLRLALPDEDEKNYDIPYSKHTAQRQDGKKVVFEMSTFSVPSMSWLH